MPIPERHWKEVFMDFVSGLPDRNGHDCMLVVVDWVPEPSHHLTGQTSIEAKQRTSLCLQHVSKIHVLPTPITSDMGMLFTSTFWTVLCTRRKIEAQVTTAYNTETDQQTKRLNAVIERYICCHVSYQQDNWTE